MKCKFCNNFMLEEMIAVSMDETKPKSMSARQCIYCGRIEHGTVAEIAKTVTRSSTYFCFSILVFLCLLPLCRPNTPQTAMR